MLAGDSPYTSEVCATLPTPVLYTLSVTKAGSGNVASSPSGIDCGATCSASFLGGKTIALSATPAAGSTFAGWSGAGCSGADSCIVTLTAATTLTASFTLPDTTPPAVSIITPTAAATYSTGTSLLTLGGTASDNVGVTQVSWTNDRGGSGTASGTTSWSVSGLALQSGTNLLSVTARDAAGQTRSATLTVTYTPPDTTPPAVSIITPTAAATYSTGTSLLTLGGTASDNVGVTQVSWTNDRGGSGTASGTTSWSVSGLALQSGTNLLSVTARDAAGQTRSATLTVTYTPPDTTPPAVSIITPTAAATYSTGTSLLTLGGTASDNVGVTQVSWTNDRGGSGTASGTTSWSVSGLALQSGTNLLSVTARDAAGQTRSATLTVTYTPPDTTPPAVSIITPTAAATYSTGTSLLTLGGTASDNVGVTQVSWTNDRGGSGTASGTTSWSVSGLALQSGTNLLSVTARDAAGQTRSATLTVTYTPPITYYTLSVFVGGSGKVTSTPSGIDCGIACRAAFGANTTVTLTATPATRSTFTGWGRACAGTGPCTLTLTKAKSVTATFKKTSRTR